MCEPKWTLRGLTVVVVLAAGGTTAAAQSAAAPKPAATVNGEIIPLAEVEAILKARGPNPTPIPEGQKRQMQMDALFMLIDDLLLQQFLRKNLPLPAPAEVNKRLAELADALKKQGKTLADFYKESNQTEAEVRTSIVNMLQWTEYLRNRITEADIQRYYDDNREFFDQVKVRASHIVFRLPPTANPSERQAAEQKLRALRQEIVSGKLDFAEAARKYSQCQSAANGGDINYFARKWVVDEAFAKAAFALKVGEVSDLVQTDYGLHLIKVTDRQPGQPSDFAKIKEEVRDVLVEELRQEIVSQQRKTADIKIHLP